MINDAVCLDAPGAVRLVPYLRRHVPQYHRWMLDPAILAATESEPLSLAEEEENQQSWLTSLDKLTFIILAPLNEKGDATLVEGAQREEVAGDGAPELRSPLAEKDTQSLPHSLRGRLPRLVRESLQNSPDADAAASATIAAAEIEATEASSHRVPLLSRFCPSATPVPLTASSNSNSSGSSSAGGGAVAPPPARPACGEFAMVGDCNLFLLPESDEDDEDGGSATAAAAAHARTFEVEVMVADTRFRRRGLAEAAVRLLMRYAAHVLGATRFVAKILDDNDGSIRLFERRLRFVEFKKVPVFHEVHFTRTLSTLEELAALDGEGAERLRGSHATCGRFEAAEQTMKVFRILSP